MIFTPAYKYLYIEEIVEKQVEGNFQWEAEKSDLVAVKIIAGDMGGDDLSGEIAIVISTMIQKIEYKKTVYKIVPDSAIVGFIDEE